MRKPDRDLGSSGEKLARSRLEIALQGAAAPFSGFDDKGVDLVVQFQPSTPNPAPMYFGVQVKTGTSFGQIDRAHWRLKNISSSDLEKWSRSNVPIVLVWIRPGSPDEYLWTTITKETNIAEIRIAKSAKIAPSIRHHLSYLCPLPLPKPLASPLRLCNPPLGKGLRQHAKEYYRSLMSGSPPINPILGSVSFTWAGWHHLTDRARKPAHIQNSLQLLAASRWGVENPTRLLGARRLPTLVRGDWVWESRLIAFECSDVPIQYRAPGNIIVVIKQEIIYPRRWTDDVSISKKIRCCTRFLSIYEKVPDE